MTTPTRSNTAAICETTMSDRRYGPDEHNADYERGREDERAAIVAWLSKPGLFLSGVAEVIERGEHLRDDDE